MKVKNEMKIKNEQQHHKNLTRGSLRQSIIAESFWFLKRWLQKCY